VRDTLRLLHDRAAYESVAAGRNPYGDGTAAQRIKTIVEQLFIER
jgi:UDP-N-acetylglucosamine 2-epimerase